MSKQEFIDRLRAALTGRIAPELVQEHVNYYGDYINTRIRMGDREEDVLGTLGDPRLIAKTIIETSGQSGTANYESAEYQNAGYRGSGYQEQRNVYVKKNKSFHLPVWLWGIIFILMLILILGVVFTVLSAFAPVIIIVIIVVSMMKFFDWLN